MAPEASQFESSEMLGAFVASTPLLEEARRLCRRANTDAPRSFSVELLGRVSYVAFSAVQAAAAPSRDTAELDHDVFGSFCRPAEGQGAVAVDAAMLQIFLSFYASHHFKQKMLEVLKQSKSVVFAGESVGGAIASLSAVWVLSYLRMQNHHLPPISVLCITFGSPMLGNQSFSQAILRERWDGNFCHAVAAAPSPSPPCFDRDRCPFGNYMFCSDKGAVCLDNATAILKFLQFATRAPAGHDYFEKLCWKYLKNRGSSASASASHSGECEANDRAGMALALQTLGIPTDEEAAAMACLATARRVGWPRNLNNAKMAVSLAKINPCRAELEWYKKYCDDHDLQLGYYDSFKRRGASRREFRVNMNRLRLGRFWDQLIEKMETNQLTRDFHRLPKYVNASHLYNLLVEPLEIAEYYRTGKHREKGHYMEHGREKRFKVFDKWWRDREEAAPTPASPRTKYANLTQDSCFWARLEEAISSIYDVVSETDAARRLMLLDKIGEFEQYANGMIQRMEVSVDVLAHNSSYNLFRQEWTHLKAQLQLQPSHFPRFQDGMVQ